jgi:streptomycin 6-kinase
MEDIVFDIPLRLKWLEASSEGRAWLRDLPSRVQACTDLWALRPEPPYTESYVSFVLPVTLADGTSAVLKLQFPHSESEHEAEALRCWNGQGSVRLLAYEPRHHALLLEKCEPGDPLSGIAPDEALEALTEILPRLWIDADEPFVSLREESAKWAENLPSSWERAGRPFEMELLDSALHAIHGLRESQGQQVLVNQDLHGDNVLRAKREPWLVIDPKPLVGEREFSIAPIVRSYEFGHSQKATVDRLDRLTNALGVNRERARLWAFAQTLAWSFESERALDRHVQTARWLSHA